RPQRRGERCSGLLPCPRRARFERKLGNDARALDGLEGIARHACFSLAGVVAIAGNNRWLAPPFLAGRALLCFQTTRKPRGGPTVRFDGSVRARHEGRCRAGRTLFLTRERGAISKSAPRRRWRYDF